MTDQGGAVFHTLRISLFKKVRATEFRCRAWLFVRICMVGICLCTVLYSTALAVHPELVLAPATITGMAAGAEHTCVVTTAGSVKCWGGNTFGQLGNDKRGVNSFEPVDVVGLQSGFVAITTGDFYQTCVVDDDGGVKCWGFSQQGQVGNGSVGVQAYFPAPVDVIGLDHGVSEIAAGTVHTCALIGDGVKCWGSPLITGGSATGTPVDIAGLEHGVAAISANGVNACVITVAGGVKCWGSNLLGQLGNGESGNVSSTPVDVVGLGSGVRSVAVGVLHSCALTNDGYVKCWGANTVGALGDGGGGVPCGIIDHICRLTPVDVVGLEEITAITAGAEHNCAVNENGDVKCWGANGAGQLGDGTTTNRSTPVDVVGLHQDIVAIDAGVLHTCALDDEGIMYCWGSNQYGQLGNGTLDYSSRPVRTRWPTSLPADAPEEFTPIGPGINEPNLLNPGGILDQLYGLQNVVRLDDGAADQLWLNLNGTATARVKYADFSHTFGFLPGGNDASFVSLITIEGNSTSSPFTCLPSCDVMLPGSTLGERFRFALDAGGLYWSSRPSDNPDASDHMVSWLVTKGPHAGNHVIAWENLPDPGGQGDYNDLVVELQGVTPMKLGPDLVVQEIIVNDNRVQVVIKNQGNAAIPADHGFWVDVYINPGSPPRQVNETWRFLADNGLVWGIDGPVLPMDPNEVITLSIGDSLYWPTLSHFPNSLPPSTQIYVQVDSANTNSMYGGIFETHERDGGMNNNFAGPLSFQKSTALAPTVDAYLPVIAGGAMFVEMSSSNVVAELPLNEQKITVSTLPSRAQEPSEE